MSDPWTLTVTKYHSGSWKATLWRPSYRTMFRKRLKHRRVLNCSAGSRARVINMCLEEVPASQTVEVFERGELVETVEPA